MKKYIIPLIISIIILFIITYSFLDSKTGLIMRIFAVIIHLGVILLIYLFLKKYGLGIIATIIILGLLILLYLVNFYIEKTCDAKGKNSLLLYLSLALGLYFFFNQEKKLADCSYKSFALSIIFSTLIGALVLTDAPVFILCLLILYYIIF